jgi:dipicolinate synthase subunit A
MFHQLDATISMFGYENATNYHDYGQLRNLDTDGLHDVDVLLLPVSGVQKYGVVETLFAEQPLQLREAHLKQLKPGATVFTGIASELLRSWCVQARVHCTELLNRDDVAIYNSIPTAEGAIMLAIQQTDFTIHGATCLVLGYGRVGVTLAKTLQGLGAVVHVGVRRLEHFARAFEAGHRPFYFDGLPSLATEAHLVFNTVPALVITADIIVKMRKECLIIDLASKPGGTDFRFADKRGIKALLALGLPGKVASKTAGQILANVIMQQLNSG